MTNPTTPTCWVCHSTVTRQVKSANYQHLSADSFRITDANYGVTADIFQCQSCGFKFCPNLTDLTQYYEEMQDEEYENTRAHRALQLRHILHTIRHATRGTQLLDVGAGSGILVEEAIGLGYTAQGIEPSNYLSRQAAALGLPVTEGCFPQDAPDRHFDIVTLIDVIEHVSNPGDMLRGALAHLNPDGICVIVTPDAASLAAKLMGWRWWHYRLAHVGYFSRETLVQLTRDCGFEVLSFSKPGWYFPARYLFERVMQYIPAPLRIRAPKLLNKVTIPLNLRDSMLLVCKPQHTTSQPDIHTEN